MKTSQLYSSPWLKPEDLQNRTVRVRICDATVKQLPQQDGTKQGKAVLSFVGKAKQLILNRTQHSALVSAVGSDDTEAWIDHEILLSPGSTPQGQATINIAPLPTVAKEEGEADAGNPFH